MRDASHASDRPAELLERGVAFDVLCESLESVRRSRKGRVVLVRVARLSAPARLLLEAVAVVPPQAELWLLDALAEDVDCLQECLASGVLAAGPAGVAFRHELARGRRGLRRAEPANRLPYG